MWLFLTVPWAGLRCVIVVFSDHTYLLFYTFESSLLLLVSFQIWASPRQNLSSVVREKQRRRPACACAQSDQRLCFSLNGKYYI